MNQHAIARRLTALPAHAATRLALKLDAVVSGANGVAYLAAADLLDAPLGVPAPFLRGVGAFFLVFAAGVWLTASTARINRPAVTAVIALNAMWVIASLAFVAFGWHDPTTGGAAWAVLQGIVVAAFATLQALSLRRVARL